MGIPRARAGSNSYRACHGLNRTTRITCADRQTGGKAMNGLFLALALLSQGSYADSIIAQIGIDQKLNSPLNANISFRDDTGRAVKLGDYFGRKPIILTPVYYACPMLCSQLLNGLVKALRVMPLTAGKDFEIVTFSIDPNEE